RVKLQAHRGRGPHDIQRYRESQGTLWTGGLERDSAGQRGRLRPAGRVERRHQRRAQYGAARSVELPVYDGGSRERPGRHGRLVFAAESQHGDYCHKTVRLAIPAASEEPSDASTSQEKTSPCASTPFVTHDVQVNGVPGLVVWLIVQTMKGAWLTLILTTRSAVMVLRSTPVTWMAVPGKTI